MVGHNRHRVVDTLGFVLAVCIHDVGQQDNRGAILVLFTLREMFKRLRVKFAESCYGCNGLLGFVPQTLPFTNK
ncbi:MAG: hypothetical protein KDA86_04195 [Planctomycetaceae bacterium]|nr:hypothetical protein [Planctomycetaceae bacterium]